MKTLEGKVVVITGGNSGIGLATAQLLHEQGAKVAISGRDQTTLDKAVQAIGEGTLAVRADVRKLEEIEALFQIVQRRFGSVDILFANAGVAQFFPIDQTTEALYDELLGANLKGAFFTLQRSLPHLNDGASVIFNTSVVGHMGMSGSSAYAASKAGVRSLVRVAAAELAARNIRVNAVSPGPIETPIFGRLDMPREAVDATAQALQSKIPLGRFGKPEEVAQAVLFLASSASSFTTGVELEVGGGIGQV